MFLNTARNLISISQDDSAGSTADSTSTTGSTHSPASSYSEAQGVYQNGDFEGSDNIAPALAVALTTSAISGTIFFILARRKKDEDEDDGQL